MSDKEFEQDVESLEKKTRHEFCARILALVSDLQDKEEAEAKSYVPLLWEMTLVDLGMTLYNKEAGDRAKVIFVDKEPEVEDLLVLLVDNRPVCAWPNSVDGRKNCAVASKEFEGHEVTVVTMNIEEVEYE